ncbi:hypothetical protein NKJ09_32065 [Mesorhizobium sp. M0189]|uniref:hypothetical protein n=1 Tax=Mesorhizobium sp. M0189 TaxID=2956909 RepID=UPI00333CF35B
MAHRRWLARQNFEHTAQQIVFQEKIDAIEDAAQRLHRLDEQLRVKRLPKLTPDWAAQVFENVTPTEQTFNYTIWRKFS